MDKEHKCRALYIEHYDMLLKRKLELGNQEMEMGKNTKMDYWRLEQKIAKISRNNSI